MQKWCFCLDCTARSSYFINWQIWWPQKQGGNHAGPRSNERIRTMGMGEWTSRGTMSQQGGDAGWVDDNGPGDEPELGHRLGMYAILLKREMLRKGGLLLIEATPPSCWRIVHAMMSEEDTPSAIFGCGSQPIHGQQKLTLAWILYHHPDREGNCECGAKLLPVNCRRKRWWKCAIIL